MKKATFLILSAILVGTATWVFAQQQIVGDKFVSYTVNPQKQALKLYWKNDKQENFKSLGSLKAWFDSKHQKLVFAMNGGMYKTNNSPLGLFIENGKTVTPLNKANANGNFYLKPNGVFYIDTANKAAICKTENFVEKGNIKYATQSGPMLVIDGKIHPSFTAGSTNVTITNGMGILPNNQVVFAMSKKEISLYDFAVYFKNLGCKNALYLDGFVSRTYLPGQNWVQTDGNFGVIFGVSETIK